MVELSSREDKSAFFKMLYSTKLSTSIKTLRAVLFAD